MGRPSRSRRWPPGAYPQPQRGGFGQQGAPPSRLRASRELMMVGGAGALFPMAICCICFATALQSMRY